MAGKVYRTSEMAVIAGIHPNTVRSYEKWGLIPPVKRARNGYRQFTQQHLDCLLLSRLVFDKVYPGRYIRKSGVEIIQLAVQGDWGAALEAAYTYSARIEAEQARSHQALALLERWAAGVPADATQKPLSIAAAAQLLGVSTDILRNWERNGLLEVPRSPQNGYRCYGAAEISRCRVIRMLSSAGHSQMAILKMLTHLDQRQGGSIAEMLQAVEQEEDIYMTTDQWLLILDQTFTQSRNIILLIEAVLSRQQ